MKTDESKRKRNERIHAHLFSRDPNSPIRYNKDRDNLNPDDRKRIEDIKQKKNVPLIDQSELDDPFFPYNEN